MDDADGYFRVSGSSIDCLVRMEVETENMSLANEFLITRQIPRMHCWSQGIYEFRETSGLDG